MQVKLKKIMNDASSENIYANSENIACTVYNNLTSQHGFDPLSPHDALKHHFTSLKTDLIFLQIRA